MTEAHKAAAEIARLQQELADANERAAYWLSQHDREFAERQEAERWFPWTPERAALAKHVERQANKKMRAILELVAEQPRTRRKDW